MKETIAKFTSNSYLSVGLVITLVGAAISFGIMLNRVGTLELQVTELKGDIKTIGADLNDLQTDIAELRVLLLAEQNNIPKK